MTFQGQNVKQTEGVFAFSGGVIAKAHPILQTATLQEFWRGCTYRLSELTIKEDNALVFTIGTAEALSLNGNAYSVNITPTGVCVAASTPENLIFGFVTLAQRIKIQKDGKGLYLHCCQFQETPLVKNRMIHFCLFPDTELWELEKFVRFCGALKYSHIILEFWGTFPYECLKELAWKGSPTKEQLKRVVKIANDFGMEVIPMLNCWGHATASRCVYGKHVVLDQKPALAYLYDEDGWCWDIENPATKELLGKMRDELCQLCGKGEYFHIGCDEAYGFTFSEENVDKICGFINELCDDLAKKGRRIMMWGDMLLNRRPEFDKENPYEANCPSVEFQDRFMRRLDKRIVIADWQYSLKKYPAESAIYFTERGFDTLICPWSIGAVQSDVCIDTAKNHGLFGVMHTTWHTLPNNYEHVFRTGVSFWEAPTKNWSMLTVQCAGCMRKANFADGDYEKSGFSRYDVSPYAFTK